MENQCSFYILLQGVDDTIIKLNHARAFVCV